MRKVNVMLNGTFIATAEMTTAEIRKAEYAGFTIVTK